MIKGVEKLTKEDEQLIKYLCNCIADYIEKTQTERKSMMAALSYLCLKIFNEETPLKYNEKLAEVDDFCEFLKSQIRLN